MQIEWRKRLAKLTSNILNPFSTSLVVVILLSFTSTSSTFDALKWSSISIALSILPVFAVIVYLVHNQKLEGISIKARKQRNKIYLLASACVAVSCVVLHYLGAPLVLVVSFVAGFSAIVIFICINLWWKISVHTAFVAASVTVLTILYGPIWAITGVLLPLIVWARIELEYHSLAQVITGALLAALTVAVVFHFFGLVGFITYV